MKPVGVVGNLARDLLPGVAPRPGGGPVYAAQALRALARPGMLACKCAAADRPELLAKLAALGLPMRLIAGRSTATFGFEYDGEERRLEVIALGDSWTADEAGGWVARALDRVEWVHVAPLLRSDFPAETLERLARGRRLLLDGQGLVRVPELGPLRLDDDFDPDLLRFVAMLKLSEEEAKVLVGEELEPSALMALGVREVVVTLGSRPCDADPRRARPDRRGRRLRHLIPGRPQRGAVAGGCGAARLGGGRRDPRRAGALIAWCRTALGDVAVDLDAEEATLLDFPGEWVAAPVPATGLPRVVAAAAVGSTVIALVDAKPPLLVSHDAGRTWRGSGHGLPKGRHVAISAESPDTVLYATATRLWLSEDGGRFWRSLAPELPEIAAIGFVDGAA